MAVAGGGLEQRQQRSGARVMVLGVTWSRQRWNNVCAPMAELEVVTVGDILYQRENSIIIKIGRPLRHTALVLVHYGITTVSVFSTKKNRTCMGISTLG